MRQKILKMLKNEPIDENEFAKLLGEPDNLDDWRERHGKPRGQRGQPEVDELSGEEPLESDNSDTSESDGDEMADPGDEDEDIARSSRTKVQHLMKEFMQIHRDGE